MDTVKNMEDKEAAETLEAALTLVKFGLTNQEFQVFEANYLSRNGWTRDESNQLKKMPASAKPSFVKLPLSAVKPRRLGSASAKGSGSGSTSVKRTGSGSASVILPKPRSASLILPKPRSASVILPKPRSASTREPTPINWRSRGNPRIAPKWEPRVDRRRIQLQSNFCAQTILTIKVDEISFPIQMWIRAFLQEDVCSIAGVLFDTIFSEEEIQNCTLSGRSGTDTLDFIKRSALLRAVGWMKNKDQSPYDFNTLINYSLDPTRSLTDGEEWAIQKKVFVQRRCSVSRGIQNCKKTSPTPKGERIRECASASVTQTPKLTEPEGLYLMLLGQPFGKIQAEAPVPKQEPSK